MKIIMVTARALQSERLQGYDAGADDYLTKPFDHDELRAKVRVYMALRSAQEIDRLRQTLLSLLRHETQTPVSIIQASLEILLDDPALSPSQRQISMMAAEATKRLTTMIDRALLLSRLQSGEECAETSAVPIDRLFAVAIDSRRPRIEDKRLRVTLDVVGEHSISVDHLFEEFVLGALLDCQIDRCEAESELSIQVEPLGAQRLAIRLSRRALPDDDRYCQTTFEAFNTTDLNHHTRGDGLGLAIAQSLILRHGGTLDMEVDDGRVVFHVVMGSAPVSLERQIIA
jgi:two-component system, sensor histidine kinase and response regulator